VVYCPVGLHHRELWAYDTETGEKQQILPDALTSAQGCPKVWKASDGRVYGLAGKTQFLCKPDGIDTKAEILSDHRVSRDRSAGENLEFVQINSDGDLVIENTKTEEKTYIPTDYTGKPLKIYCVGPERNGKIWGGTISPAITFACDIESGKFDELGRISGGRIQVYDIENPPPASGLSGLFLASYTGASLNYFDPAKRIEAGTNPFHFERAPMQERPVQWCHGPDGKMYVGTVPVKGRLGGALIRIDPSGANPAAWEVKNWRNIVPDQSIYYCCAVPETNEVFCVSSIYGGTSAKPTEKEASVVLWDCETETVSHTARPIPGTAGYSRAVRAETGIIYGLARGTEYYAFDPVKRETVFTGELPGKRSHFPGLADHPVGEKSLIYGLMDDAVFAIDPVDHSVSIIAQHDSLNGAFGFYVTRDGVLYYGSGAHLWRCDLSAIDD
jgi:hypothetical protein